MKVYLLSLQFDGFFCSRAFVTNFSAGCLFPALHHPFFLCSTRAGKATLPTRWGTCPSDNHCFPPSSPWMLPTATLASVSLFSAHLCPCTICELSEGLCRAKIGNRFERKIAFFKTGCFSVASVHLSHSTYN